MTIQELITALIGPFGGFILALVILYVVARVILALWKEHLKADQDDRDQRDRAQLANEATKELLRQSLLNNAEAIAAWNKRTELDAARRRRADNP